MPTAKRLKSNGKPSAKFADAAPPRPTVADLDGESSFAHLARQHWLKPADAQAPARRNAPTAVKVKNDVLKKGIWDCLEKDAFPYRSLLVLEGLQTLESYLWPGYTDDSSNFHVLLIALLTNVKARERLDTWSIFEGRSAEFSTLFRRVLSMTLDHSLSLPLQSHLLNFIIFAFQSLDWSSVRKECAPLVSISTWHNLASESKRDACLNHSPQLRKAWKAAAKRYDSSDEPTQARMRFDRAWLYTLVLNFLRILYLEKPSSDHVLYCERFVEFLSDLLSQLPTRRYVNTLLRDLHVLSALRLSPMFNDEANMLLRDQFSLLSHYTHFSIDDHTGVQLSRTEAYDRHCADLARLQRTSLRHFKEKLTVLALSNYGSIDKRTDLEALLEPLSDEETVQLADHLQLRTGYPDSVGLLVDRRFLTETILATFEKRKTFQETARDISILPTEEDLFDQSLLRTDAYDGSQPLALPKLKLQYLSVGDFLWRALVLYRCEAFYGIRKDIDTALRRLRPESRRPGETTFPGFSRMALAISKPSILEVAPPLVGDDKPSSVRAEISLDVRRLADKIRQEWDSLRPGDVVFLVAVDPSASKTITNGGGPPLSEAQKLGLLTVRTAEVAQIQDDKGRSIKDPTAFFGGHGRSHTRRFQLRLDPRTYKADTDRASRGKPDVYEKINLIVRRNGRENNFRSVLESIQSLALSEVPLASWLHENFLGYGDPSGATYRHLVNRVGKVDFRDTFLDWQHLIESLPGKTIEPSDDVSGSFGPPYMLESIDQPVEKVATKLPKKRRRDIDPPLKAEIETYKVSTYKPPNMGPYPVDVPRRNKVRFTPAQIDAIISGTQPGLTVIVGPPGTGKTDVATQIISNIYHNFPEQRTLLIAHSNQALNQLFAKIVSLDIDERHLLRLGHGEEELDTEGNFSKHGRVESFLEIRNKFLQEVNRLAASIGAPGAHGNSAETAGYFNSVYIQPAWTKFTETLKAEEATAADIVRAFPFHAYFSDAPQPLFPPESEKEAVVDIANGCHRHISKIFSELEDVLPFEILRRDSDKANYLLTNEARIIAMTSTHAAMRRAEIASLGFHYDNVVMEEAAQITEVENFIPLAMQKPKDGQMALQRVVLCGDHYQNSPVIQSLAFRHYANLEQSLFSRFVRLGIPVVTLDQQGRARPSLAALYQWRYPNLGSLPHVENQPEFRTANAGFKYEYQFINVSDYKGSGEKEPTPHFIQNLGEAEYAVAIYQYMRLLGYPANKITILATYAGQRALIKDILAHRCARNTTLFGLPRMVTTVDKYQGEQNDYIILSLTRTSHVGFLRDIRRLTVALSRARLGLYVLGRREVFEACYELAPAFEVLLRRPDKLVLATGEMWPSERLLDRNNPGGQGVGEVSSGTSNAKSGKGGKKNTRGRKKKVEEQEQQEQDEEEGQAAAPQQPIAEAVMEGVEHLGAFVYEMSTARLAQLREEQGLPPVEAGDADQDPDADDGGVVQEIVGAGGDELELEVRPKDADDDEGEEEEADVEETADAEEPANEGGA